MLINSLQSFYYILTIICTFCGVAYKLGYEIGKNERK